jgi:phosphatidylinositol phospholipase C delta
MDKSIIDPFVQVSVHIPDWVKPGSSSNGSSGSNGTASPNGNESRKKITDQESLVSSPLVDIDPNFIPTPSSSDPNDPQLVLTRPARVIYNRTSVIKDNGFNPVWEESLSITFDVVGDMKDLVFVRFTIKDEGDNEESRSIAVYCSSLGSLRQGKSVGYHEYYC